MSLIEQYPITILLGLFWEGRKKREELVYIYQKLDKHAVINI